MPDDFQIRNLRPAELTQMYLAFLDAFSDYSVPFRLSKEQFVRKFVEKLKIDFSLSVGAFDYDAMAGFVFTSVNYYNGQLTAYNGGTGVRPYYRGKKITRKMFEFLVPLFEERKIKQCVLEVLVENERAIKTYEQIGFVKEKNYQCYILDRLRNVDRSIPFPFEVFTVNTPNWDKYNEFCDESTSFLDSPQMINENLVNESIVEVHVDHVCIGYAIFQPHIGRISQIAVHPDFRRYGIGTTIINHIYEQSQYKKLSIININDTYLHALNFFERLGFHNELNQYEMILTL